jgi:non-specific serine/threonine protein kinase
VLFRRLAVFVGGCTLEAAEAVCPSPEGVEPFASDVLDGLGRLVDQSLVQQREEGEEARFGLLQVVREYALDLLEESGESEAQRRAHAAYMLALAERAEPEMIRLEASAWYDRLEREHDNLRAALGWARERTELETGLRLVAALRRFWEARGYFREGQAWLEALVKSVPASEDAVGPSTLDAQAGQVWARAFVAGAALAVWQGEYIVAAAWLEQATMLGRAALDLGTTALALIYLGVIAECQGEQAQAGARYEESLALYREVGERAGISLALANLGLLATLQGDLEKASDLLMEALALCRKVGDQQGVAGALNGLKTVALKRGEIAQAEALGREALALDQERGDLRLCAVDLEGLACIAGAAGQGERAARLLGAAATLREALSAPQPTVDRVDTEQAVAAARTALGEEAWSEEFAAGRALSLESAITEALNNADDGELSTT